MAPSLSSSSPYDKQVKTLLLCDTLHLVGFQIYDRKAIEDDKKKENRHRLLGFESTKKAKAADENQIEQPSAKKELPSPSKFNKPGAITSFLDGFANLTEDDMEILAEFEEEQQRKGHFETLFPTRETIDTLGPYFDSQRHANTVLWQYIRQKQPI